MSSELRVDKIVPTGGIGSDSSTVKHAGGVVQIVEVNYCTDTTVTSTSFQQLMSGAITPKFATSKIRVEFNLDCSKVNYYTGYVQLLRGSTQLRGNADGAADGTITVRHGHWNTASNFNTGGGFEQYAPKREYYTFLDAPNSTSAVTYNIKARTQNASYPLRFNRPNVEAAGSGSSHVKSRCTLTLTEYSA